VFFNTAPPTVLGCRSFSCFCDVLSHRSSVLDKSYYLFDLMFCETRKNNAADFATSFKFDRDRKGNDSRETIHRLHHSNLFQPLSPLSPLPHSKSTARHSLSRERFVGHPIVFTLNFDFLQLLVNVNCKCKSRHRKMDECPVDADVPVLHRTVCILTYGGGTKDCWINYASLFLTLTVAALRSKDTCAEIREQTRKHLWTVIGTVMLFSVCTFQWSLCLVLGCSGISIIWCAVVGWIINERKYHLRGGDVRQPVETQDRKALDIYEDVTLTMVLIVLIYYAITASPITSVAHFCALMLGTLLSRLDRWLVLDGSQIDYELGNTDE